LVRLASRTRRGAASTTSTADGSTAPFARPASPSTLALPSSFSAKLARTCSRSSSVSLASKPGAGTFSTWPLATVKASSLATGAEPGATTVIG